jgi:putative oxygen-independent coproporphyrinogen III oxidase
MIGAPIDPLTGISAARFGVYVHFPYCLSKCPYCDFASIVAKVVPQERYAKAIERELELRLAAEPALRGREVDSIFFGGGTPSLWHPRHVGEVLAAIGRALRVSERAEITLEANPGASDVARFSGFRAAGVNRLSIGVQSFELETLKALGRAHDADEAERAFRAAREAGFDSVSMDFIYGVQGQRREGAIADAKRAVSLGPDHLSAYALTLDKEALAEEVPLAKQLARGEVHLPPDEDVIAMSDAVREVYAAAGLERYEISNYARKGHHSRHNSLYWTGGEYLALGTGATGFLAPEDVQKSGTRWSNQRSAEKYLAQVEAGALPEASREEVGPTERFEERVAMGLRLTAGVRLREICARFGEPFERREREAKFLAANGMATFDGDRLALTPAGLNVHSAIAARLF